MTLKKESHAVAEVVSEILLSQYKKYTSPKIVVNGLTKHFGEQLHLNMYKSANSFYVAEKGSSLIGTEDSVIIENGMVQVRNSENDGWMFVIPDHLVARLPDSIETSKRSHVFASDWPWKDDDNLVSFWGENGVFLRLMQRWNITNKLQIDRFKLIIETVLNQTKRISLKQRRELVIDYFLGGFNLENSIDESIILIKFLNFIGIPITVEAIDLSKNLDYATLSKKVINLSESIFRKVQSEENINDLRGKIHNSISENETFKTFDDNTKKQLKVLMDTFIDGLLNDNIGMPKSIFGLHCGFKRCINNPELVRHIDFLSYNNLFELFECEYLGDTNIIFDAKFEPTSNQYSSDDNKHLLGIYGEIVNICLTNIKFENVENDGSESCEIVVSISGNEIKRIKLNADTDTVLTSIDSGVINNYKNDINIQCAIEYKKEKINSEKLKLLLVGDKRPKIILISEGFTKIKFGSDGYVFDDQTFRIENPSHIVIASLDKITLSDEKGPLDLVTKGCYTITQQLIDPHAYHAGRVDIEVSDSLEIKGAFTLESTSILNGADTIDLELEDCVIYSPGKIQKIISRFTGENKTYYAGLGGLSGASFWRKTIAKLFEESEHAHYPILINLESNISKKPKEIDGINARIYCEEIHLKYKGDINKTIQDHLTRYKQTRDVFINSIKLNVSDFDENYAHPIYASVPTFCVDNDKSEKYLADYVETYANLMDCFANLEEHERNLLLGLDSVVISGLNQKIKFPGIKLLGPWHPITCVYRYSLQKGVTNFVDEHLLKSDRKESIRKFSRTIRSLRKNGPLSRFLTSRDGTVEFTSLLNYGDDSGWVLSIDNSFYKFLDSERDKGFISRSFYEVTGMHLIKGAEGFEKSAALLIQQYLKSFSTDRRLELQFNQNYSIRQASKVIAELNQIDMNPLTDVHSYLTGGVHVLSDSGMDPFENDELETLIEESQNTFFYQYRDSSNKFSPDIYFCPMAGTDEITQDPRNNGALFKGSDDGILLSISQQCIRSDDGYIGFSGVTHKFPSSPDNGVTAAFSKLYDIFTKYEYGKGYALKSTPHLRDENIAPWVYLPAHDIDPALVIRFLIKKNEVPRTLWEYKIDIEGSNTNYYILTHADNELKTAIKTFMPNNSGDANSIIENMNKLGIALSAEAQRSSSKAKGCIGIVGAAMMIDLKKIEAYLPKQLIACLVPVDSFSYFLNRDITGKNNSGKITDLILIKYQLPDNATNGKLVISAVGIESKYCSDPRNEKFIDDAMNQARCTVNNLKELVNFSSGQKSIPVRSALIRLFEFSLRLRNAYEENYSDSEALIYENLVNGNYIWMEEKFTTVVVLSEAHSGSKTDIKTFGNKGILVELNTTKNSADWHKVSDNQGAESDLLIGVKAKLTKILSETVCSAQFSSMTGVNPIVPTPTINTNKADSTIKPMEEISNSIATIQERKITLGVDALGNQILLEPVSKHGIRVENDNLMITGSSGKGKTQLIKSILMQYSESNISSLILDFKNDFSTDMDFLKRSNLNIQWVAHDGLPYNPLIPIPMIHPGSGKLVYDIGQHISGLAAALKNSCGLGTQQEAAVKDAMRTAYSNVGLPTTGTIEKELCNKFPDFNDISIVLSSSNQAAKNRLDPLFDLSIFRDNYKNVSFSELIKNKYVLDVSQIQSDEVQNMLAYMLIYVAHRYYNSLPHVSKLRQLFVFDEAHRVLRSPDIEKLTRECRAYGVGVLLSSQRPGDFPQNIRSNLATKIVHGNNDNEDDVNEICRLLNLKNSESDVAGMGMFTAYVSNSQHKAVKIKTLAYPHLVLIKFAADNGAITTSNISQINGVHADRIDEMMVQLIDMGFFAKTVNGFELQVPIN